jgi:hypothetical protein
LRLTPIPYRLASFGFQFRGSPQAAKRSAPWAHGWGPDAGDQKFPPLTLLPDRSLVAQLSRLKVGIGDHVGRLQLAGAGAPSMAHRRL